MRTLLLLAVTATIVLPAAAFAVPTSANAAPAAPAGASDDVQSNPAAQFVQNLGDRAISQARDKNGSADEHDQKYRELLRSSFDMPAIAHFVAGRAYKNAPPEQQKQYMDLFEKIVVKTYGDRLDLYSGEGFRVRAVRPESDKDSIVNSEITHPDGSAPTKVDWRVHQANGKMSVVDVVVQGVSQSVTQHDEYASIIQRDGGKLDGLIQLMQKQVRDSQNP